MRLRPMPALLLCASLLGCATPPWQPQALATGTTFLVVRHAEKADDGSRDPPLDAVGMARAQRLATALHAEPVVAVYATGYRRTQQTAAATAADHALAVTAYAADLAAPEFAARLRSQHPSGTVVVVGHSNTAPGIAAALCDCTATPLGDADYGRVYRIHVDAEGHPVLRESILP